MLVNLSIPGYVRQAALLMDVMLQIPNNFQRNFDPSLFKQALYNQQTTGTPPREVEHHS